MWRNKILKVASVSVVSVLFCILMIASGVVAQSAELPIGAPGWQPNARAFLFHIPFFRQRWSLSCELASLRSALKGMGIEVSEQTLWSQIAKDSTPRRRLSDGSIVWGDPSRGFVGNIKGRQPTTGYGVFFEPVMDLASRYATTTRIRLDDPRAIDVALGKKHPIIAWTVIKEPSTTTWKTPEGKSIIAPLIEHTTVVVGYRGTGDFIEGLYVIDPLTSLRYETWDEFQYRTSFFDHVGLEVGK